jgi:Family of unknown function (DUF6194)
VNTASEHPPPRGTSINCRVRSNKRTPRPLAATTAPGTGEGWSETLGAMTIDEIISFVDGLDGVLTLRPGPGDGTPEIAWGDTFFYYSPNGVIPQTT